MTTQAIVFGGTGFIGTHLCAHLRATDAAARIVAADIAAPEHPVPDVVHRTVDVRRPIPLDLAEPGRPTVLYNLAAVHRTPGHPTHEYYETNVLGAVNIGDFARAIGAEEVVFTSSIAVYGPDETRKSETTPPTPESAYGWSKLLAEAVHRSWREEQPGRRLTIVRPAVIFGAGEKGNFTRLASTLHRGLFFFPGRRDTVKACGYVDELVRAIEFVRARNEAEVLFNFCYGRDYTIEEICAHFHEVGGLPRPRGTVPLPLMNLAAMVFEVANACGLRNGINRDRIQKLVRSTNIEPGVLKELGYEYTTDLAAALRAWAAAAPAGEYV
ncbi:MAG: NAD-dependent epimerase/dehydratase family protein [Pseudomonadota bacterium]